MDKRRRILAVGLLSAGLGTAWWLATAPDAAPRFTPARPAAPAEDARAHRASGPTTVRLLDEAGAPVVGVQVWAGDGAMKSSYEADGVMRGHNTGELLGESDARGDVVPLHLPATVNVAPWPSEPATLDITDDGRVHVLQVARRCAVELSWDPPGDPAIVDVAVGDWARAAVGLGRANLVVPCGTAPVLAESGQTERLEPVPSSIDTTTPRVHVRWKPRESVRICVTDESGDPLPTAEVQLAWRDGDCWRYPGRLCAGVSAAGFLNAELCPESPGDAWLHSDYTLALERGVLVEVRCDDGSGAGRCPDRVGILQCVSDSTPDVGHCVGEPLTCTCPDAPDAAVLAQGGPYAGERAPTRGGVATLRHTGTASLTVASADYCGALLLRDERDGQVLIGKLKCEDGAPKRGRLVAGQYVVMSMGADRTQSWSGIEVAEGEQARVDLTVPPTHPVDVEWSAGPPAQVFTTVELGDYQASSTSSPSVPVQVPAGATLWACAGDGCCRYQDPGERVSCDPGPGVSPPIPQMRL